MKLYCTSDTHGKHEQLNKWLPKPGECDVFIFAGDFTARDSYIEFLSFMFWLAEHIRPRFKDIIVIAGNHDACFENLQKLTEQAIFELGAGVLACLLSNIHYLQDSDVEIDNVKFWGSPWTPPFCNWSFMAEPREIKKKWDMIPNDTDVLITHGPSWGILDLVQTGSREKRQCGCKNLEDRIDELNLQAHIFGHIHEAYGQESHNGIQFANVAACNGRYELVNKPIIIEI